MGALQIFALQRALFAASSSRQQAKTVPFRGRGIDYHMKCNNSK
jgi:hypothetical protein